MEEKRYVATVDSVHQITPDLEDLIEEVEQGEVVSMGEFNLNNS